jgi:hypothetical protein
MNPSNLMETVDALEAVRLVVILAAVVLLAVNLRLGWDEADWAIDDQDPTVRRLGPSRLANAALMLLAILFLILDAFSSLSVHSPIQTRESTELVVDALNQRIATVGAVACLVLMGLNDAWWRRDAGRRRGSERLSQSDRLVRDTAAAVGLGHRLEEAVAEVQKAVEANQAATAEAKAQATAAFEVANTINEKLVAEGVSAAADRALYAKEQGIPDLVGHAPPVPPVPPKPGTP